MVGVSSLAVIAALAIAADAGVSPEHCVRHELPQDFIDSGTTQKSGGSITARDVLALRVVGGQGGAGLSVAPSGRLVAFEMHRPDVDSNTYSAAWIIVSLGGSSSPRIVGDAGDPTLFRSKTDEGFDTGAWVSERPVWSLDSQWIFYRRKTAGEIQIWRSSRDGCQQRLTRNRSDVERFELNRDGTTLLFSVGLPRSDHAVAVQDEERRGFFFDTTRLWSATSARPLSGSRPNDASASQVWAYDLVRHVERPATNDEVAEYSAANDRPKSANGVSRPDARALARLDESGPVAWFEPASDNVAGMNPPLALYVSKFSDGRRPRKCEAPACVGRFRTVTDNLLWWIGRGTSNPEVAFVRMEGPNFGRRVWYAWDPARDQVRRILSTDSSTISECLPRAPKGMHTVCLSEQPSYPRSIISIDLRSGDIETIFDPNPSFKRFAVGKTERLEWHDTSGRATFGFLVMPVDYKPGLRYPLVIIGYRARGLIHGGIGEEYPAHLFSANGFAVLAYDMPEEWDVQASAADQTEVLVRTWRHNLFDASASLQVLRAAVDLLDARGLVDPQKVGMVGFSTGVSQVTYAAINSRLLAAAIISQPDWNPTAYYLGGGGTQGRKVLRQIGLGPLGTEDAMAWQALSLSLNICKVNTPILINASDTEYLPGVATAVAFADAGKPIVEMHVYAGEGHVKWHPTHLLSIYERNLQWFDFWLRGHEIAGVQDSDQYLRWRAQRSQLESATEQRYETRR